MATKDSVICKICYKEKFKYVCPKCNIQYCSLPCYKSQQHLKCSEEFYKGCVEDELNLSGSHSKGDVKKIYDILKRVREADPDFEPSDFDDDLTQGVDSDDDPNNDDENSGSDQLDIADRMIGVNINDTDDVWKRLTKEERQEFERLIGTGEIMKVLPEYTPWWFNSPNFKVVDLSEKKSNCLAMPKIQENIPQFSTICQKKPSPFLHYNLWNILSSYACTVKFFRGEHVSNPLDTSSFLVNLSATLKYGTNFEDADDAITSVEMESLTNGNGASVNTVLVDNKDELKRDAKKLMSNTNFQLAGLSDILHIFKLAKQELKGANDEIKQLQKLAALCSGSVEINAVKLNQLIKKIVFLLSYVMLNK